MDYPEKYDAWHQRLANAEASIKQPRHPWYVTVAKLLPDLQGQRVLEIGCGRGDFSIWLANKYPQAQVLGVGSSDTAINTAQARAAASGSAARFKVEDAQALSFDGSSFDHVISCECLEHVLEPHRMANEIRRVLHPGGHFILTTENYFNGMILQ